MTGRRTGKAGRALNMSKRMTCSVLPAKNTIERRVYSQSDFDYKSPRIAMFAKYIPIELKQLEISATHFYVLINLVVINVNDEFQNNFINNNLNNLSHVITGIK